MSWITGVRARVRDLLWRSAAETRTREEFEFHLEMEIEQNLRRGLPASEARRRALLSFGGAEQHGVELRRGRRLFGLEDLWQDVRLASRSLLRVPGFAIAAVLTLALGIGLTTTMFSVVYGVLFRGLPHAGADRIMHVSQHDIEHGEARPITIHDYLEYARGQRTFEQLGAFRIADMTVSDADAAARYRGARVSEQVFAILGVRPALGRNFTTAEQHGHGAAVAIISHELWQSRYDGASDILGRAIRIDGRTATIVGVMPADFTFPERQQLWLPLEIDPLATAPGTGAGLDVFGRMHAGVSISDAQRDLARIVESAEASSPFSGRGLRPVVRRYIDFILGPGPRALLYTMFAAVGFVLLIACTNVANLLLSRAVVRSREVGIRAALGAGRARIIKQFFAEAAVLSAVGAAAGLLLAYAGTTAFNAAFAAHVPAWMSVQLDRPALAFTTALALLTALIAGILPALQASRANPAVVLSDSSRGATSFRMGRISRSLVVFEVALSCTLLVGAALCMKSVVALRGVDLGFDGNNLFTAAVAFPEQHYADSVLPELYARLDDAVRSVDAFETSALASSLPGLGGGATRFAIPPHEVEREADLPSSMWLAVSPSYLGALGVAVVAGRNFTAHDVAGGEPVAMVNRNFARRYFSSDDVIGRRIRMSSDSAQQLTRTIVGVVPNLRFGELAGSNEAETILIPLAQQQQLRHTYIIGRTRGAPLGVTADVHAAVATVDRDLPLLFANTLRGAIARDTWFFDVFGSVFMVFGVTALILAAIGLYGVMSFAVGQRRREIGIRLALGATASQVRAMLLRNGLTQTAIGAVIGMTLAFVVANLLSVILFEAAPGDPFVFVGVIATLLCTAMLACIVPARRAASIQSVETLQA